MLAPGAFGILNGWAIGTTLHVSKQRWATLELLNDEAQSHLRHTQSLYCNASSAAFTGINDPKDAHRASFVARFDAPLEALSSRFRTSRERSCPGDSRFSSAIPWGRLHEKHQLFTNARSTLRREKDRK